MTPNRKKLRGKINTKLGHYHLLREQLAAVERQRNELRDALIKLDEIMPLRPIQGSVVSQDVFEIIAAALAACEPTREGE